MKALKLLKNSRKRKRAILRFHKVKKFFLLLKNNPRAKEFILKRMEEKRIDFNIEKELSKEFFEGLIDLFKLECLGCVMFNHKFFQFVEETHSIPYRNDESPTVSPNEA